MSDPLTENLVAGNVAERLTQAARRWPERLAVAEPVPGRPRADGQRDYREMTFSELERDSSLLADGMRDLGMRPGMRIVLMVRPGIDFISLVFALFKAGLVTVLIDPGMGRRNLVRCLQQVEPDGFVAIPLAHAIRTLLARRFPRARHHVTVGRRWFWGGATIDQLRSRNPGQLQLAATRPDDPAAIIFTTGSTGPPKGVLYRHRNFVHQAEFIRAFYDIQPGEIDLPCFPLFALFNCAMGVSTIIPDMDPTRPADVDPRNIIGPIQQWRVTQAFGSPALWNAVGRYCEQHDVRLPSVRRILSAGAPVPVHVLRRMRGAMQPDGAMHTPYGATEALPVASISAREVLEETADASARGRGTCVGRRFAGIRWQVIRIDDGPLERMEQVELLPPGEIGELMVSGPVVTQRYVTAGDANRQHKVRDGDGFWHRMGDVGYLDEQDRFWFCGRKSHRVCTERQTLYTIPCEAIFNAHPRIYRSALVGVGPRGHQRPVLVAETWPDQRPRSSADRRALIRELLELAASSELTAPIRDVLLHRSLPVDIRHNSKIFREQLAVWAGNRLAREKLA